MDPAHLQILHQELTGRGRTPPSTTRGFTDDIARLDFRVFSHGIIKRREYRNGTVDEHPLLFSYSAARQQQYGVRVPIDDEHLTIFEPYFEPSPDGSVVNDDQPPATYLEPFKNPPHGTHPFARFRWNLVAAQDAAAWRHRDRRRSRTERLATPTEASSCCVR